MTAARPQVDLSVIDEMALAMNNEVPPPLVLKRFERRVEQLLNTDRPEEVWSARVALAALEWDSHRALEIAQRARNAVGGNPKVLSNIAASLHRLNEIEAAVEYVEMALQANPVYTYAVHNLVTSLVMVGRWREAEQAVKEYIEKVGAQQAQPFVDMLPEMTIRRNGLAAAGVTEGQVRGELAQCWGVLREQRIRYPEFATRWEEEPESGGVLFVIEVRFRGDLDREMQLDSALAVRLAKLPEWDPTRLSLHFRYLSPEDAHAPV